MSASIMAWPTFINTFRECVQRDRCLEPPAFTLVLGAGASRSAGVPMTQEMIEILEIAATVAKVRLRPAPARETLWSWRFRTVLEALPWRDEFSDYSREFMMACIGRAGREPNVTHLVAAHLVQAGVVGDIVTTNFDDLALAAFWNLPVESPYLEPHVIYDPRSSDHRIASNVPVVIKAHGHHTSYSLGIVDQHVKVLAPFVKRTLQARSKARRGYLVVGYSGGWDDGIMAVFKDRSMMHGMTIYWFFRGSKPPYSKQIDTVAQRSDLRFVRIADSDLLFLRLWYELHSDEERFNPPILEPYQFFNSKRVWGPIRPTPRAAKPWWDVREIHGGDPPRLVELRKQVLPILKQIERLDERCLIGDCLPRLPMGFTRGTANYPVSARHESAELQSLKQHIPVDLLWTRRNRKLLRIALSYRVDPSLPCVFLHGLSHWTLSNGGDGG